MRTTPDRAGIDPYREYRGQLFAATFPSAVLVLLIATLACIALASLQTPPLGPAALGAKLSPLLVPLVALILVRGPLRRRVELVALALDLAFTALLVAQRILPDVSLPAMSLLLVLKMTATGVLLPWPPAYQYRSVGASLALYALALAAQGASYEALYALLGTITAGALSALAATLMDVMRRRVFVHKTRLVGAEGNLRDALDSECNLLETAREISQLTDLDSLLRRINQRTATALRCDFSTMLLLDVQRGELAEASTYTVGKGTSDKGPGMGFRTTTDSRVAREILAGRSVAINDPDAQTWVDDRILQRHRIRRLALSPIIANGRVLGVLTAGRIASEVDFDDRQIALLDGLAAHSAVALENARLFEGLTGSEARYRELFERANDLIFVIDEDGSFHFANQAALDFLRTDGEQLPRLRWHDLLVPTDRRRAHRRIALVREGRIDPRSPFEVEVLRPEGASAVLELRTRVIRSGEQARLIHCIARDVSDRRRQELEMRDLVERLRASSRLQSEFVANMSHELRTPLNVIIGYTDLLLEESAVTAHDEARSFTERIAAASRALHRLVESVLEYARLDRGRTILIPRRFTADDLVRELGALCEDVPRPCEVALRIQTTSQFDLVTDYDRLYSTLSNLLLNAIKFTPRGAVTCLMRECGEEVEFEVCDTGIGIAGDELRTVFEPFRQVDGSPTRTYGGVGLGLAIVRRNVHLLGGSVEAESQVGRGSRFVVRIPRQLDFSAEAPERISA